MQQMTGEQDIGALKSELSSFEHEYITPSLGASHFLRRTPAPVLIFDELLTLISTMLIWNQLQ